MQNNVSPNDCLLVIDDDVVMRELLALLLDAEGRTVRTAESGDDALKLLTGLANTDLPSVVLTDLRMPGLPATALAQQLRLACPASTLLIAMSGSEPAAGVDQAFDAFLHKPFTVAELDAALERARTRAPAPLSLSASAGGKPTPRRKRKPVERVPAQVPALDEVIYAKLFAVMGATQLPQLYTLFMDDAPARVARMQQSARVNDEATFIREAHAIKGGCGMLGATEIHALANRMEAGGLACSPLLVDFQRAFERLRRILEERMMIL
jgi:CheY-like chemotaxis protein